MPLVIEENLTGTLAPMLRDGRARRGRSSRCLSRLPGVKTRVVYEEPFNVVVPDGHRWSERRAVKPGELADENLLVLNNGHCFRDQVLEACPGQSNTGAPRGPRGQLPGNHRNMVASGLGVSVLPASALGARYATKLLKVGAFHDAQCRRARWRSPGARASTGRSRWSSSPKPFPPSASPALKMAKTA
jgi:LysR family hydrogen peroxide-inducible transcriptional activator